MEDKLHCECKLPYQGKKDHQTNDLPNGANRACKGEQLGNGGVPQILSNKGNNENSEYKRQDRRDEILVHITSPRSGHIRHSFHSSAAQIE